MGGVGAASVAARGAVGRAIRGSMVGAAAVRAYFFVFAVNADVSVFLAFVASDWLANILENRNDVAFYEHLFT
jgi:hypothetical protein